MKQLHYMIRNSPALSFDSVSAPTTKGRGCGTSVRASLTGVAKTNTDREPGLDSPHSGNARVRALHSDREVLGREHTTETHIVIGIRRLVPVAIRTTQVPLIVVPPRAPAQNDWPGPHNAGLVLARVATISFLAPIPQ